MLSDQDIFQRYQTKRSEFEKQAEISLIGHSLFDLWQELPNGTPCLNGKSVANLGISGVSARQYLDVLIRPNLIPHLGCHVFIFLGVNDIVKEPNYSPAQVLAWISEIWQALQHQSPQSQFFLLEATPVNQIATTDNPAILALNTYLKQHCPAQLQFVPTWEAFVGMDGKLQLDYCVDGLHFSTKGYQVLQQLLEQQL